MKRIHKAIASANGARGCTIGRSRHVSNNIVRVARWHNCPQYWLREFSDRQSGH